MANIIETWKQKYVFNKSKGTWERKNAKIFVSFEIDIYAVDGRYMHACRGGNVGLLFDDNEYYIDFEENTATLTRYNYYESEKIYKYSDWGTATIQRNYDGDYFFEFENGTRTKIFIGIDEDKIYADEGKSYYWKSELLLK